MGNFLKKKYCSPVVQSPLGFFGGWSLLKKKKIRKVEVTSSILKYIFDSNSALTRDNTEVLELFHWVIIVYWELYLGVLSKYFSNYLYFCLLCHLCVPYRRSVSCLYI